MARWIEIDGVRVLVEAFTDSKHPRDRKGRWRTVAAPKIKPLGKSDPGIAKTQPPTTLPKPAVPPGAGLDPNAGSKDKQDISGEFDRTFARPPTAPGESKDEAIKSAIDSDVADSVDLMLGELARLSKRDWANMRPETKRKLDRIGVALGVKVGSSNARMVSVAEALLEAYSETLHPRDRQGHWVAKVKRLREGQSLTLPGGSKVVAHGTAKINQAAIGDIDAVSGGKSWTIDGVEADRVSMPGLVASALDKPSMPRRSVRITVAPGQEKYRPKQAVWEALVESLAAGAAFSNAGLTKDSPFMVETNTGKLKAAIAKLWAAHKHPRDRQGRWREVYQPRLPAPKVGQRVTIKHNPTPNLFAYDPPPKGTAGNVTDVRVDKYGGYNVTVDFGKRYGKLYMNSDEVKLNDPGKPPTKVREASLEESGELHSLVTFDPEKHPRNRRGEFADVLGKLTGGGTAKLPSGITVKAHESGRSRWYTVHDLRRNPVGKAQGDANAAAGRALMSHNIAKRMADNRTNPDPPLNRDAGDRYDRAHGPML